MHESRGRTADGDVEGSKQHHPCSKSMEDEGGSDVSQKPCRTLQAIPPGLVSRSLGKVRSTYRSYINGTRRRKVDKRNDTRSRNSVNPVPPAAIHLCSAWEICNEKCWLTHCEPLVLETSHGSDGAYREECEEHLPPSCQPRSWQEARERTATRCKQRWTFDNEGCSRQHLPATQSYGTCSPLRRLVHHQTGFQHASPGSSVTPCYQS